MPLGQMLAWKRGDLLGGAQRLFFACGRRRRAGFLGALWRAGPVHRRGGHRDLSDRRRLRPRSSSARSSARRSARARFLRAVGLPLLGLGHGVRPCRSRRHPARPRGDRLGRREHRRDEAGRSIRRRPLVGSNPSAAQQGPNYRVVRRDGVRATAEPSRRSSRPSASFPTRQMSDAEAGIVTLNLGQIYVSIAESQADGTSTRGSIGSRWCR